MPEVVLALVLLAGISVGVLALRRRHPYLLVGWLWYLGMLVPMIGVVHAGTVARADRFTYLAQIGVYIMLAWAAKDLIVSWRYGRRILGVGAFSVIVALMVCTWKQTTYWRNSESLWTHTLACTSDNATAYDGFGNVFLQQGRLVEAIAHFQKALQIHPDFAEARLNLGNALLQKGEVDEAITHFQRALQIYPDFTEANLNLGYALLQKGKVDEAITQFQKALQLNPDSAEAHLNLGNALLQKGKVDEAIIHCQKALQINPDNAEAHNNLGNALLQKGKVDEAIAHYQKALQLKPDYSEAYNNLGYALLQKGNVDEAIVYFQKALQINPNFVEAHNNLGNALFQKGKVDEAITHFQRALQINPDFAEAHYNLGNVLLQRAMLARRSFITSRRCKSILTLPMPKTTWPGCWPPVRRLLCATATWRSNWPSGRINLRVEEIRPCFAPWQPLTPRRGDFPKRWKSRSEPCNSPRPSPTPHWLPLSRWNSNCIGLVPRSTYEARPGRSGRPDHCRGGSIAARESPRLFWPSSAATNCSPIPVAGLLLGDRHVHDRFPICIDVISSIASAGDPSDPPARRRHLASQKTGLPAGPDRCVVQHARRIPG